MAVTVNDLLESILNPNGRFTALDGIYALVDESGAAMMRVERDCVVFEVSYRGVDYLLECPLRDEFTMAGRESYRHNGAIGHATIFAHEMLVIDSLGKERRIDVALWSEPGGENLTTFIDRAAGGLSRNSLGRMFGELCNFYLEVGLKVGIRRSIRLADVYVLPIDGRYKLTLANHSPTQSSAGRYINGELLSATLALFIFCLESGSYDSFSRSYSFRHINLRRFLELHTAGEGTPAMQPFFSLLPLVLRPEYGAVEREYVRENIERLQHLQIDNNRPDDTGRGSLPDLTRYNSVGSMSGGFVCVCRDGRWSYLNEEGTAAFDSVFEGASDFAAGRAVVWQNGYAGLIDSGGGFILPPENEDICWDADEGVVRVLRGGYFALFDRDGSALTGFDYDALEQASCGLMLAQKDGMYGYLSVEGKVMVDFIYDNAYSFANGRAPVDYMGISYDIDTSGRRA